MKGTSGQVIVPIVPLFLQNNQQTKLMIMSFEKWRAIILATGSQEDLACGSALAFPFCNQITLPVRFKAAELYHQTSFNGLIICHTKDLFRKARIGDYNKHLWL